MDLNPLLAKISLTSVATKVKKFILSNLSKLNYLCHIKNISQL